MTCGEQCLHCGADRAEHQSRLDQYDECHFCDADCERGQIQFDLREMASGIIVLTAEDATELISRGFEIPFPKE